jgi:hypothetical protein
MATRFTQQEELFLSRIAEKMVAGLSMEDAGRAVLADDHRIVETYQRSPDRGHIAYVIAKQVFASVHTREALA